MLLLCCPWSFTVVDTCVCVTWDHQATCDHICAPHIYIVHDYTNTQEAEFKAMQQRVQSQVQHWIDKVCMMWCILFVCVCFL